MKRWHLSQASRLWTRAWAPVVCALLIFAWPGGARAQSAGARAAAQALFDQARDLMKEGKYGDACPKLEESQRLDPAVGTQFNLASCYEKTGKTASAWATYLDVAATTKNLGEFDREKVARTRAAALEPGLSKLTVTVPPAARVEGLHVQRGAVDVGSAMWGVPTPVDPGAIALTATAPGKKNWTGSVQVAPGASAQIAVPVLEDAPAAPAATPDAQPVAPAGSPPGPDQAGRTTRPIPTAVWVSAGVTGALTVGAVVTGIMALSKRSDFNAINDANHPADQKQSAHDSAVSMGVVNTALTAAAFVGAGVTAYFYFSRPERPVSGRTYVTPWVAARSGGLVVGGTL